MAETKKESVVNQIYDLLKEQIITIRMVPRQLLLVQQLAQDLGVSRTPVREALIRLKEEGLVDEADGHKFRVSAVTWDMIEKCYQSREIVEIGCIEIAAKQATPEDVENLKAILREMEAASKSQNYSTYFEYDGIFHTAIVDILHNDIMSDFIRKNANQQQRIRYCSRGIASNMQKSLEEHHKMVKAIEAGDAKKAVAIMSQHLSRSRNDLNSLRDEQKIVPLILIK